MVDQPKMKRKNDDIRIRRAENGWLVSRSWVEVKLRKDGSEKYHSGDYKNITHVCLSDDEVIDYVRDHMSEMSVDDFD